MPNPGVPRCLRSGVCVLWPAQCWRLQQQPVRRRKYRRLCDAQLMVRQGDCLIRPERRCGLNQ